MSAPPAPPPAPAPESWSPKRSNGDKIEVADIIRAMAKVSGKNFRLKVNEIKTNLLGVEIWDTSVLAWKSVGDLDKGDGSKITWIGPLKDDRPIFRDGDKDVKIEIGDIVEVFDTVEGWEEAKVIEFKFESEDINTIMIQLKGGEKRTLGLTTANGNTFRLKPSSKSNARVAKGNQPPNNLSIFKMAKQGVTPRKPLELANDKNFMNARQKRTSRISGDATTRLKKSKLVHSFKEEMESLGSSSPYDNKTKLASFKGIMKEIPDLMSRGDKNAAITTDEIKYMMKAFVDSIGSLDVVKSGGEKAKLSDIIPEGGVDEENLESVLAAFMNLGGLAEESSDAQRLVPRDEVNLEIILYEDIHELDDPTKPAAAKFKVKWDGSFTNFKKSVWKLWKGKVPLPAEELMAIRSSSGKPQELTNAKLLFDPKGTQKEVAFYKPKSSDATKKTKKKKKKGGARRRRFTVRRGHAR